VIIIGRLRIGLRCGVVDGIIATAGEDEDRFSLHCGAIDGDIPSYCRDARLTQRKITLDS
jgi:hypothetical protein